MNVLFCSSEVALTHICSGGKSELLLTQLLKERLRCWEVRTAKTGMGLISSQSSHWRRSWQGFSCVAQRHFGKHPEEISLLPFKLNESIKAPEGDSASFQLRVSIQMKIRNNSKTSCEDKTGQDSELFRPPQSALPNWNLSFPHYTATHLSPLATVLG